MNDDVWPEDYVSELEGQIDLSPELLSSVRFVDVEASSLLEMSHPIELGVASLDMSVESMLIKPLPHWDDWSWESQGVHNISPEMLERDGEDARLVALRANALLQDMHVFSDNPSYDNHWCLRLFADVDVRMGFKAQDYDSLRGPAMKIAVKTMSPAELIRSERKVETVYLHTHRAGEDAVRMAALIRFLVDREWRQWFDRADYDDLVRDAGRRLAG